MEDNERFLNAIKAGEADSVRAMLEATPGLSACRDDNGVSALMVGIYHRQPIIANLLASCRELDLYEACAMGQVERVQECLDSDPTAIGSNSPDGFPPLGLACFFGQPAITAILLGAGADPNAAADNPTRVAPIHGALASGDVETAIANTRLLLDAGADVNQLQHGGWRPLHSAAASGSDELVDLLLEKGATPQIRSDEGKSPSDMASERGHGPLADRLKGLGG